MGLTERMGNLRALAEKFPCDQPHPLLAIHRMDPDLFRDFQITVMSYVSRSAHSPVILDENLLLDTVLRRRDTIMKNCTPNGAIIAKNYLILEFNAVYRAYADILASLNIGDLIDSLGTLLNIRFKEPKVHAPNVGRKFSTEYAHSDAWVGESVHGINIFIPLLGDVSKNRMDFFVPDEHFSEDWLQPISFAEGQKFLPHYTKIDVPVKKGFLYLFDYSVLHQTMREPNAGPRVSLDNTLFPVVTSNLKPRDFALRPKLTYQDVMSIGREKLLLFHHSEDEQVETQNAKKHPAEYTLIDFPHSP